MNHFPTLKFRSFLIRIVHPW